MAVPVQIDGSYITPDNHMLVEPEYDDLTYFQCGHAWGRV